MTVLVEDQCLWKNPRFHAQLAWTIIGLSPVVTVILVFLKPSTYGKLHQPKRNLFGPLVTAKWCWMIFESPNWIWVLLCWWNHCQSSTKSLDTPNAILLVWFLFHYLHRSILYPLQMSNQSKFPIGIMAATLPYCMVNG